MDHSRSAIGANVVRLLRERGLSQAALAAKLGVTQPAVSQKLRGTRPTTALEVEAIAEFLDVDPGELFRQLGDETPTETAVPVGARERAGA